MLGWQPHASLPAYYQQAQVGLIPFLDSSHIRITLANKLFDYMAAGLPVIAVAEVKGVLQHGRSRTEFDHE